MILRIFSAMVIILSLLTVGVETASAAAPPTSDGALHFQPPLNNGSTGSPEHADTTLLDAVNVVYCRVTTTGCTPIGEANSVVPGVDLLLLTGTVYGTAFSGTLHGVRNGDVVRITVRVAGLSLGSTQLTANILAPLPSSTQFNPLVPLTVGFRIDRNPVIRTRYLHDRGQTATQVAGVLKNEFGLDDLTAASVLYNDIRVGDVIQRPGRAPYALGDLIEALSSPSTYGDSATRTAKALVGKFPGQDIVNGLVASPTLNVTDLRLLDAIQNGLGVTDPRAQLDMFRKICVPNVSCAPLPPCIPGRTCVPARVMCSAVLLVTGPNDPVAIDFRGILGYPDATNGTKFLSTPITGCGFDLNTTARLLRQIYFSNGSGTGQATNIARTLMGGFTPGGITADSVVEALAKAPITRQAGETVSCVAAVGAINGAGFPLVGAGSSQDGVLNALGNKQSLLDPWQQTGTGNGLDKLGNCLVGSNVRIPFPLLKVQVQFTEAQVPSTSAATGHAFVVGRAGWLPQLPGQQLPSLGDVRGVDALKQLPVPNFNNGGPLNNLSTLPALALTGGCLWYPVNSAGCSTAREAKWSIPEFDPNHVWETEDCPADDDCGKVLFRTAAGGRPDPGKFTMVVPALPGVLNFEGSTLVRPNLLGCNTAEIPAIQAGALAASAEIWKLVPNGNADYLSTGSAALPYDATGEVHENIVIPQHTDNVCGRITTGDPYLKARVDVTHAGTVTQLPGDLGQTTLAVPGAQGPAGANFSIGSATNPVGAISDLSGMTGQGNLLSALAQAGVPVSGPNTLITLMRTGFLP